MASRGTHIGTCGFAYKDWLGNFYPPTCPQQDLLRLYASKFSTVEIDATFYRIPSEAMVRKWADSTPPDFTFAAKFPQTVTHSGETGQRLDDARRFVEVMRGLGEKLGPLLLQFPYSFKPDQWPLLSQLLADLPAGEVRLAVELRNKSWLRHEELFAALRERNVGYCLIDHPWMPRLELVTADFVYIRLLGDRAKIESDFSFERHRRDDDLRWWRDTIEKLTALDRELFVFFNNHYTGHSPTTAARMIELLQKGR